MTFSDALPVQFWLTGCETFNEREVDGIYSACFCQPINCDDEITIQFTHTSGYSYSLLATDDDSNTLFTTPFTQVSSGLYQASFTPRAQGVCDSLMRLRVTDSSSPAVSVATSDCLSVKEDHDETILINYHNNRRFVSIDSSVGTPDPEFNLRVPAIFFHDRYPRESESIDLSNNTSFQTTAQIKRQRKFDVKHMPDYMHLKLVLVLSFHNVTIDSEEWKLDEPYEKSPGNPRYPLKTATTWLTMKNYVVRNVL